MATSPASPAVGDTVILAAVGTVGWSFEYELTAVPPRSALALGALLNPRTKAAVDSFVPDVPGVYSVRAFEFFDVAGLCGAYEGDPLAARQHRLIATATFDLDVGEAMTIPLEPVNGHGATLRCVVVGTTVRAASLTEPRTELARLAAADATVAAAVAALEGVAVDSLDNDLATNVNELRTRFEAHRVDASHASSDTANAVLLEPAYSNDAGIRMVSHLAQRIGAHQAQGASGLTFHDADDTRHGLAVSPSATNLPAATVLSADLRFRVFERHRVLVASPASHRSPGDVSNAVAAALPLSAAIVAFLDYVSAANPTAPTGESEGMSDAAARFGFTR